MRRRGILNVSSMGSGDYSIGIPKEEALAGDFLCVDADGKKNIFRGEVSSGYTPIGVVVIPPSHDVYGTGEGAVISLKYMNYTTPNEGSISYQSMYWGGYGSDISILTNFTDVPYIAAIASTQTNKTNPLIVNVTGSAYLPSDRFTERTICGHDTSTQYYFENGRAVPSPYFTDGSRNPRYYQTSGNSTTKNALSDFNGVDNTNVLTDLATGEDWKNATSITNNSGSNYYPAACCCWRYSTVGTVQGNWYLPACGELGYLCARFKIINNAIQYLIDSGFSDSCLVATYELWSSSERNNNDANYLAMSRGVIGSGPSKDENNYVRAFLRF